MGGRLGGLQWLSLLEPGVAADVPDVQQFGISGLWVPRMPSTQVTPLVGIHGSDRRRRRTVVAGQVWGR
jgi:hypothetical protein